MGEFEKKSWFYVVQTVIFSIVVGIVCGVIGTLFHLALDIASELFHEFNWLIFTLPILGLIIVFLYQKGEIYSDTGTNGVFQLVKAGEYISFVRAPLIFVATTLTQLGGGSSGREGAALQLGSAIASFIAFKFKLSGRRLKIVMMAGMSALFSALFGTPLTAVIFCLEIINFKPLRWISLAPSLIASYVAYFLSVILGTPPTRFDVPYIVSHFDIKILLLIVVLAGLCGGVSILFCQSMHYVHKGYERFIKNPYIRIFVGGMLVMVLTSLLDTNDYNGGGMEIVSKAMMGETVPYAFLVKILFTALTLGAGFKGGEIVPTMFIGATFGCFMGELLGLSPQFSSAVGLIAVFCGCVNCPFASIILSAELFGFTGFLYFVIACLVSFVLSGRYCLYEGKEKNYEQTTIGFIKITINKMKKRREQ